MLGVTSKRRRARAISRRPPVRKIKPIPSRLPTRWVIDDRHRPPLAAEATADNAGRPELARERRIEPLKTRGRRSPVEQRHRPLICVLDQPCTAIERVRAEL